MHSGSGMIELADLESLVKPTKEYLSPVQANNLILQIIIVAVDPISADALKFITRFFTPKEYDELIEERTVISKCGYPTCSSTLKDGRGNVRQPQNRTVLAWQHHFCQLGCFQSSEFYRRQLSLEPLVTRKDVAFYKYGDMHYESEVLLLPEVQHIAKNNNKSIVETVAELIKNQKLHESMQKLTILEEGVDTGLLNVDIKENR